MAAVLADWRTAPVEDRLRSTLGFLEAVTLRPEELTASDVPAGVSSGELVDALYVAVYFNLIDRLADSFGFDLPTPDEHAAAAPNFLAAGYV